MRVLKDFLLCFYVKLGALEQRPNMTGSYLGSARVPYGSICDKFLNLAQENADW